MNGKQQTGGMARKQARPLAKTDALNLAAEKAAEARREEVEKESNYERGHTIVST